MKFPTAWEPGDRRWFRLPVQRITYANALGSVYAFYRPDGKRVAWFWRRRSAQALADRLNRTAKGAACDHVYEARPIDGSRRASVPVEAVCQKCGYRPEGGDHG